MYAILPADGQYFKLDCSTLSADVARCSLVEVYQRFKEPTASVLRGNE